MHLLNHEVKLTRQDLNDRVHVTIDSKLTLLGLFLYGCLGTTRLTPPRL
jgi:hypothetical protein